MYFPFCFSTESERKMAEVASAADALQRSLKAELTGRLALEAVVTSASEGFAVSATEAGSSLRGQIEDL